MNIQKNRPTLLEHFVVVQGHRCLVSGDSLSMHLAPGSGVRRVFIFIYTSPWEIYRYGLQKKIVSRFSQGFFYKSGYDPNATTAISVGKVIRDRNRAVIGKQTTCEFYSGTRDAHA